MSALKRIQPVWLVILAGVCAALHVGKLAAALPVLRDALGVSVVQAGFLLSLVQLAGMTLGIAVGLMADAIGLRRTMIGGLWILAGSGALGASAHLPEELMLLRAFEGLGFLLVTMPGPGLIRRLVAANRLSAALGIWSAFMPLGTALALLGGPLVMAIWGWQALWEILAAVTLAMGLSVAALVPADARSQGSSAAQAGWAVRLRDTLSSQGSWLVAVLFAVYSAQWIAVIGFLPSMYSQVGLPSNWTAVATSLAAAANIIGNVASGRMLHRGVRPDQLLLAGYTAMGLGAWIAFGPLMNELPPLIAATLRYAAILIFSSVGGMIPGTLFSLAVRVAPDEGTISTTVGWMQQWSCLGQFAGPPMVAWVALRTGGWGWTWLVTGACALSGIALTLAAQNRLRTAVRPAPTQLRALESVMQRPTRRDE